MALSLLQNFQDTTESYRYIDCQGTSGGGESIRKSPPPRAPAPALPGTGVVSSETPPGYSGVITGAMGGLGGGGSAG